MIPQKDLAPITLLTAIPFVMVAGPAFRDSRSPMS